MEKDNDFSFILSEDGSLYCTASKFSSGKVRFREKVRFGSKSLKEVLDSLPEEEPLSISEDK